MERIKMKKIYLVVAAAVMGLSGGALAETAPVAPTGSTSNSQIDLLVVPTLVTCELEVGNSSSHGDSDGSALVWNVGLTENKGASAAENKSSITDNLAKLKRIVTIGFKNPSVEGGDVTNKDNDCSLAASGMTISMRADSLESGTNAYPGKILSSDSQTWFNYGVAVNKTTFTNVAETAAGGSNKVTVQYPTVTQNINGSSSLSLDGGDNATVKIQKATANTDATFKLGQYPFEVYLQKDYSGISSPTAHQSSGNTSEDVGVNQYRSHFTVTTTYE